VLRDFHTRIQKEVWVVDVVKKVMTTDVITLSPEDTPREALRTLVRHSISGAPVVDEEGHLLGIVSEYDLIETLYKPEIFHARVREIMTASVFSVRETTTLSEIANLFVAHRIRRLPVLSPDGHLMGLVCRRDLLRFADETNIELRRNMTLATLVHRASKPPTVSIGTSSTSRDAATKQPIAE